MPTARPTGEKSDGKDLSIYAELEDGFCSLMGFDWENENTFIAKLKWSTHVVKNTNFVKDILRQFATFGHASLTRGQPQCDEKKAGVVPCNLLYFPHSEHRCQLIKRLQRIFEYVKKSCNPAWVGLFQPKMNFLLQNNKYGKQRGACGQVEWL